MTVGSCKAISVSSSRLLTEMRNTLHSAPPHRIFYYAVLVIFALALIFPALYYLPQALDSTTEVILCS
jgi:hypothetical protein